MVRNRNLDHGPVHALYRWPLLLWRSRHTQSAEDGHAVCTTSAFSVWRHVEARRELHVEPMPCCYPVFICHLCGTEELSDVSRLQEYKRTCTVRANRLLPSSHSALTLPSSVTSPHGEWAAHTVAIWVSDAHAFWANSLNAIWTVLPVSCELLTLQLSERAVHTLTTSQDVQLWKYFPLASLICNAITNSDLALP